MMEVNRFFTPKGKDAFSVNGYSFRMDKRAADGERIYWRCLETSCNIRMERATVHLNNDDFLANVGRLLHF